MIDVGQNTAFNFEQKNIRIRLIVNKEPRQLNRLIGRIWHRFSLHIEDFEQFKVEKEDKKNG
jgi:hypothetical protein